MKNFTIVLNLETCPKREFEYMKGEKFIFLHSHVLVCIHVYSNLNIIFKDKNKM